MIKKTKKNNNKETNIVNEESSVLSMTWNLQQ